MLRNLLVFGILAVGAYYCFQGPFFVLLLYIWNAYFRPDSWLWDPQFLISLRISYVLGVAVVVTSLLSKERFRLSGHCVLILLILLHSLASTLLSANVKYAWADWVDFLKALMITLLIPTLVNDRRKLFMLVTVMCISLGFEGAKQGWLGMLRNPGAINSNEILFLGDNNGVAVGMLMLAPLFGALAATTKSKWVKRALLFLSVGVVYRALSTYSRGGFLSCGTLALIYWFRSKEKIKLAVGFTVTALIVLPVLPDAFWDRMQTITTYEEVEDDSALSRLHFWKVAVKMADDRPLVGIGFNSFNVTYNKYDFSFGQYGEGRSVHSVWFGVLAELGYLGLCLYLLALFFTLRNCAYARKVAARNPEHGDLQRFANSVETSIWVFLVGGSFLPFQYNEMLWHLIGVSMALKSIARSVDSTTSAFSQEAKQENPQFEFEGARA